MTEKKWHGYWWLPGQEDRKVPGSLHVQDSGQTRLSLIGGFDLEQAAQSSIDGDKIGARAVTILGLCASVKITLIGGLASLTHGWPESADYQEISGSRALIGTHLQRADDPVFASVMFTLENFGPFLGRYTFDHTDGLHGETSSVVYKPIDNISFSFEGWKFQVYTYFPTFQTHDRRGSSAVEGTTREVLIATSDVPRPLTDFDEIAKTFMDLLTLASGEACGVTEMSLEFAKDKNVTYLPNDGRSYRVVQDHKRWIHAARPDDAPQDLRRFRFTCSDMSFEELTRAWLPLRRRASAATNLLFGLYYARPGFTETRLLSAAVVAESLHWTVFGSPLRWDKEEFKSLRAAIDGSIADPQRRAWVKDRIKNETSFRERLIELASRPNQSAVAALIGDVDKWAKNVVDARNGLAHTGADTNKNGDIFELTQVTLFLASLTLMKELGFSDEVQIEALRRDEYLSVIRHKD
tara:strand:+ start:52810 stop:54207 length:1398 start_codon:yes stop_codon:yes gene_type:complete